jgi:hypothetical protein
MTILYYLSIYFATLFAPLQYFNYPLNWVRWSAISVFVFFTPAAWIGATFLLNYLYKRDKERKHKNHKDQEAYLQTRYTHYNRLKNGLAKILIVLMLLLDVFIFWEMGDVLIEMMFPRGFFFFGFCVVLTIVTQQIIQLLQRIAQETDEHAKFRHASLTGVSIAACGALFYLTIASYAYAIFPFIPNMKGGADYVNSRKVCVILDKPIEFNVGGDNRPKARLDHVIIMYSTSSSYYFAWSGEGNSARDWRARRTLPIIGQVPRNNVRSIFFESESHNCL